MAATVWELPAAWWPLVVLIVLAGGVVRGFGGFGASMVWLVGLSLLIRPDAVVPTALVLEVLGSLQMLPRVWRDIDWRSLRWLLAGAVAGAPAGIWLLTALPARTMRILLAVLVLAATVALATKIRAVALPGRAGTLAVGGVSGALNGAFAMGGPPAILMYFSGPTAAATGRASLVAYFLGTDIWGTVTAGAAGLLTLPVLLQVAALLPVSLIGIALGSLLFRRTPGADLRRHVLWLLAGLSTVTLVRALLGF
jgi:uncharacterized membrane protein YfcA